MQSIFLPLFMTLLENHGFIFKHKSETFFKFQLFKSLVENEFGIKIKILRTDHGGESIKK